MSKIRFQHYSAAIGFAILIIWILAKNHVLPPLLSSTILLYVAGALIGIGYLISKTESDTAKYRSTDDFAPGAGEKKHILSNDQINTDTGGGGGGD